MANGRGVRPKVCKVCGKVGTPEEPISFRGLCLEDAIAKMTDNNRQMAAQDGPQFDLWRERMRETFGG